MSLLASPEVHIELLETSLELTSEDLVNGQGRRSFHGVVREVGELRQRVRGNGIERAAPLDPLLGDGFLLDVRWDGGQLVGGVGRDGAVVLLF